MVPRNRMGTLALWSGRPMIFVHTPKCGGSFVAQAVGYWRERLCFTRRHKMLQGHKTYMEFRDVMALLGKDIRDYTTFSVIRDPWSWHVSLYHYIRDLKGVAREKKRAAHEVMNRLSFSEYLLWLDDMGDEFQETHFAKNVCDWVIDESGKIAVDFILRQERLVEDLVEMQDRFGLYLRIPTEKVNTSRHGDYRMYYSDSEVDFIARRHQRDIEMFGYEFGK